MGGKVTKKLGDGLMALFAYPVAHENDAEPSVDCSNARLCTRTRRRPHVVVEPKDSAADAGRHADAAESLPILACGTGGPVTFSQRKPMSPSSFCLASR
jgi:class 3 adenylate cyclase